MSRVLQCGQGCHVCVSRIVPGGRGGTDGECRFASGKGSALVIDVGEELTSVVPIYDGFVLRKGQSTYFLAVETRTDEMRRL